MEDAAWTQRFSFVIHAGERLEPGRAGQLRAGHPVKSRRVLIQVTPRFEPQFAAEQFTYRALHSDRKIALIPAGWQEGTAGFSRR